MSDDRFDAIIVGAGLAGATAAYALAQAGLGVLVVERGNFAGAKNMTGGRLYAHALERLIPGFAEEAPIERRIATERITFLTEDSGVTAEYRTSREAEPAARSYSVLRAPFDKWLMDKAEANGAQLIPGIRVDTLLTDNGRVTGVRAGEDELEADVVILADGANSLLAEQAGLGTKVTPRHCAVGVKEVLGFTPSQMTDRFGCAGKDGMAWLFAGSPSCGQMGGGFLYTNAESVSLGVVFGLHHVGSVPKSVPQMLEDFKNHPLIASLVSDGRLIEYSAHIVPEGGLDMMPTLVGDGVLVVGDAAGFCLNVGYTVRGMDLAVASGEAAAKAVQAARTRRDFSRSGLAAYRRYLEDSFVLKDLNLYRKVPSFLDTPRIFAAYPAMAAGLMQEIFTVNGPSIPLWRKGLESVRRVGIRNLMQDAIKGVRFL